MCLWLLYARCTLGATRYIRNEVSQLEGDNEKITRLSLKIVLFFKAGCLSGQGFIWGLVFQILIFFFRKMFTRQEVE